MNAAKATLLVLLLVISAEAATALAFRAIIIDRLRVHWRLDAAEAIKELTDEHIATFRDQFHDPLLGWVFKPTTTTIPYATFNERGARRDPLASSGRIVAYGDSFTFGEDVANDETWPHLLGAMLGDGVANFGVAGYGPDQALLRMRRDLENGSGPEVVILGVLSENIARVVNGWRYLYTGDEVLNFKPMWDGKWLPNPLTTLTDRESVSAAAAQTLSDYWQTYNATRPSPRFPYLWTTLDTAHYLAFRMRRWQDLWRDARAVRNMTAIVDEFVALGQQYGFRPVLLMIPMPDDLTQAPVYAKFAEEASSRVAVVDPLGHLFERDRFNLRPYAGHASAYGNQVIADAVFAALE